MKTHLRGASIRPCQAYTWYRKYKILIVGLQRWRWMQADSVLVAIGVCRTSRECPRLLVSVVWPRMKVNTCSQASLPSVIDLRVRHHSAHLFQPLQLAGAGGKRRGRRRTETAAALEEAALMSAQQSVLFRSRRPCRLPLINCHKINAWPDYKFIDRVIFTHLIIKLIRAEKRYKIVQTHVPKI